MPCIPKPEKASEKKTNHGDPFSIFESFVCINMKIKVLAFIFVFVSSMKTSETKVLAKCTYVMC